jgi:hypothetical protein
MVCYNPHYNGHYKQKEGGALRNIAFLQFNTAKNVKNSLGPKTQEGNKVRVSDHV